MWEKYWKDRGFPWEHDPGPDQAWADLFAATPNYRGLGVAWSQHEMFRWHFGPMFYRGRLGAGEAKVLIVGQEGAQDESLAHRSFIGGTGGHVQRVPSHLGLTRSYLFLNTFVYPIFGQYDAQLRPLAQDPRSPIVVHRHALFDHAAATLDLRLVIAVGTAAKESVATWVRSHGGTADPTKLDQADCGVVRPGLRAVGVLHPGGASKGGAVAAIIASFKAALAHIDQWSSADPGWLPPDPDGHRLPASAYAYAASPVPFRDLPFGTPWRLGYHTTSSNRRNGQRAIQIFSADGVYNNVGQPVSYPATPAASAEGYDAPAGALAYEPPYGIDEFDAGPSPSTARLLQGGEPGFAWPDFHALGLPGHPSFGYGPIYRGEWDAPSVLVLADQASQDDLFYGRPLCGEAGQRLHGLMRAAGVERSYAVLRTLPVDSLSATPAVVNAAVDHPQVQAVLREAIHRANTGAVLAVGPFANRIVAAIARAGAHVIPMPPWGPNVLADWQSALSQVNSLALTRDAPPTPWNGGRSQIPRQHLPFGTLRWQATSGDRAAQATRAGHASPDYFQVTMPRWAFQLAPSPLSASEQAALAKLKT